MYMYIRRTLYISKATGFSQFFEDSFLFHKNFSFARVASALSKRDHCSDSLVLIADKIAFCPKCSLLGFQLGKLL